MDEINPEWWKTLFDETYLITDARSVCDDDVTCREVDFLEKIVKLRRAWPILDLCGGQGRHALALSCRGFNDVTVLDYSEVLVQKGKETARAQGLDVQFVQGDARDTGLASHRFKAIIMMASSFGYFINEDENERILREAFRLLMPRGLLLLDLPNRDYVLSHFSTHAWHEANEDILVCRQRRMDGDIICGRELVISKSKGLIRDATYCTCLYSPERISDLLTSVGFGSVKVQTDYVSHKEEADYGCMTNRMIVIAERDREDKAG
jgi:D-alanine-D-alanine ligase